MLTSKWTALITFLPILGMAQGMEPLRARTKFGADGMRTGSRVTILCHRDPGRMGAFDAFIAEGKSVFTESTR